MYHPLRASFYVVFLLLPLSTVLAAPAVSPRFAQVHKPKELKDADCSSSESSPTTCRASSITSGPVRSTPVLSLIEPPKFGISTSSDSSSANVLFENADLGPRTLTNLQLDQFRERHRVAQRLHNDAKNAHIVAYAKNLHAAGTHEALAALHPADSTLHLEHTEAARKLKLRAQYHRTREHEHQIKATDHHIQRVTADHNSVYGVAERNAHGTSQQHARRSKQSALSSFALADNGHDHGANALRLLSTPGYNAAAEVEEWKALKYTQKLPSYYTGRFHGT